MNCLRRALLALRIWSQDAEEGHGLTGAQVFVIQQLAEYDGLSLTSLAARTLTSKAAVSLVVGRLIAGGLVRRQTSREDARRVVLSLTPAGQRAWDRAPESPQQRVLSALGRLQPRRLRAFARLFELFIDELGIRTIQPHMLFQAADTGSPRTSEAFNSPARRANRES